MSIDEWFAQDQGKVLLVPGADPADAGQCMQAWDIGLNKIYGLPYVWANAIDVWNRFNEFPQLVDNFVKVTDGSIKKGDGVVFNQKIGSIYGHIDWAFTSGSTNGYIGLDSNWSGNMTLHQVNHSGQAGYIIGALRRKGADMSDIADHDFVAAVCVGMCDVQPETNPNFMNNIGLPKSQVVQNFLNYTESRNLRLDAEAYRKGGTGTPKVTVNGVDYVPKS